MAGFRATEHHPTGDTVALTCTGRLDNNGAGALDASVAPLLAAGPKRLVLDLAGVDYLSSAGLRSLLLVLKRTKLAGGALAVCGVTPAVHEVLQMSGFLGLLPVYPDLTAALRAA